MADLRDEPVRTRLARLSAGLRVDPPAADLADRVDARIRTLPPPRLRPQVAERLRRHWRAATAAAVALLLGLLAVSPAGARIAHWLGIGAVQVQQQPTPAAGEPDPAAAEGFTEVPLDEARARAAFPIALPGALGPPDRVLIGPDATVVSMVWAGGDPVRLDQIAGRPDYAVVKQYAGDIDFTSVGGDDAFWLRVPHPLAYTDAAGTAHTQPSRIAGPTLIWVNGEVTLRLEGVGDEQRALQIARSVS